MASIKLKGDTSGELTIQAPSVAGTNTLDLPASSGTLLTTTGDGSQLTGLPNSYAGTKNLIINGNMQIAQRGTSATGIAGGGYLTIDRMYENIGGAGTWTITQDTDVPTGQGFASSLKYLCTTANASLTGTNQVALDTRIEGQNLQQLSYGTANAKTTTLSFWVKSNKTGTQTLEILGYGATTKGISKAYTIDTADTWEKKTITIEGDTSDTIVNTNTVGFIVKWWFAAGPTFTSGTLSTSWTTLLNADRVSSSNMNLADSTSNYINITGVQLEAGTTATDFENLQYGQQLALCQRYYYRLTGNNVDQKLIGAGGYYSATGYRGYHVFPTTMRVEPTISYSNISDLGVVGINVGTVSTLGTFDQSNYNIGFTCTGSTSTSGSFAFLRLENFSANSYFDFSAEL